MNDDHDGYDVPASRSKVPLLRSSRSGVTLLQSRGGANVTDQPMAKPTRRPSSGAIST